MLQVNQRCSSLPLVAIVFQVVGPYIHTYTYDKAVEDSVVLDLRYEARDIDQTLSSQEQIDQWFDDRTSGLTDTARAQL